MPPVGQTRMFGNGPASARSALIPPDCSAGKNLTMSKPCASACISSEAVAIPGANGRSSPAAAFNSSGVPPGLMPNLAPSALARARSSAFRMVPMPTMASGTSAIIALAASIATGVRNVTSSTRTPPATSALASGTASSRRSMVSTGITVAALKRSASFCCRDAAVMARPCERSWNHVGRHRRSRDDGAGMAYHNAGQTVPGARGIHRLGACQARGDIGRGKAVAGRRGIDDRRCHGLGS